jgi:hypothetical protein
MMADPAVDPDPNTRRGQTRARALARALAEGRLAPLIFARRAHQRRSTRVIARIGLVTAGLVHVGIGAIAGSLAAGLDGEADQNGVFATLSATPVGDAALWLAASALLGLAFWQFTDAAWVTAPTLRGVAVRRMADGGKAAGYAALGISSVVAALGRHDAGAGQHLTHLALQTTGGAIVLVGVAVAIVGVGISHIVTGARGHFHNEIASSGSHAVDTALAGLAVFGHLTKGLSFLLVGGLIVATVVAAQSRFATDLDGALHYVESLPGGAVLLAIIAAGLIAYGLYLLARAVYLTRPSGDAPRRREQAKNPRRTEGFERW